MIAKLDLLFTKLSVVLTFLKTQEMSKVFNEINCFSIKYELVKNKLKQVINLTQ